MHISRMIAGWIVIGSVTKEVQIMTKEVHITLEVPGTAFRA